MKKLMLLLILSCGVLGFHSCNSDDEMDPPIVEPPIIEPPVEKDPDILDLPAAGLLLYINFNENVDDQSGNAHHGIVNGGEYVVDRDTAEEGAYHMETGDYILLPNDNELGLGGSSPYSIGAFIKLDSFQNERRTIIVSKFDGGVSAGWYLGIDDNGAIRTYRNSAPWSLATDTKISLNAYYHLMATFDGSRLRIYIDGEEIRASDPWSSHPNDMQTPTVIGASYSQGNIVPSFSGDIDDLVIYNRALTETEITNMVED